jgi:hypothetical protein
MSTITPTLPEANAEAASSTPSPTMVRPDLRTTTTTAALTVAARTLRKFWRTPQLIVVGALTSATNVQFATSSALASLTLCAPALDAAQSSAMETATAKGRFFIDIPPDRGGSVRLREGRGNRQIFAAGSGCH